MSRAFSLVPRRVPRVDTVYRRIITEIPVPGSLPLLESLRACEPLSMTGQPPVVWDHAEGCQVYDAWGNMWLDCSSGVLVANIGHSHPKIIEAITRQAASGLLHNYCFPNAMRAALAHRLVEITPPKLEKALLLTTGSEATECALKLMRTHGRSTGGNRKIGIISFERGFHGRTLGAQLMGGTSALKDWVVNLDPDMWQLPFPDGYWNEDTGFDGFLTSLDKLGVTPDRVAGVIVETYQGGTAAFAPIEYMQALARWCEEHDVVLTCDEVQAAFGRTGRLFGFEHYGIVPDLICLGKGLSSSLPISAVVGRGDLMDQYGPGTMTSTHTGNPVCAAAAMANLDVLFDERLWEHAAIVGENLRVRLETIQAEHPDVVGVVSGRGLVYALQIVKPGGTKEPDSDLAFDVVERCTEKGVLFFAPVGPASIKIAPPLIIDADEIEDACAGVSQALGEVLAEREERKVPVDV